MGTHASHVAAIEAKVKEELARLTSMPETDKRSKNADVKEMLRYYLGLTLDMDAKLSKWHDVALQILGISIAAIVVLTTQRSGLSVILFFPLLTALVILALAGMAIGFLYAKQQSFNKYPFNDMTEPWNQWKWYYYGNPDILKISNRVVCRSRSPEKTVIPFLQGAAFFVSRYRTETLDNELTSNIKQLYLHQVLNYYKNRWFLQLACVWRLTAYVLPAAVVGVFLIALAAAHSTNDPSISGPSVQVQKNVFEATTPEQHESSGRCPDRDRHTSENTASRRCLRGHHTTQQVTPAKGMDPHGLGSRRMPWSSRKARP